MGKDFPDVISFLQSIAADSGLYFIRQELVFSRNNITILLLSSISECNGSTIPMGIRVSKPRKPLLSIHTAWVFTKRIFFTRYELFYILRYTPGEYFSALLPVSWWNYRFIIERDTLLSPDMRARAGEFFIIRRIVI